MEKDRGQIGVGKSCLANRFVRPMNEDYSIDHISVLSQVGFVSNCCFSSPTPFILCTYILFAAFCNAHSVSSVRLSSLTSRAVW